MQTEGTANSDQILVFLQSLVLSMKTTLGAGGPEDIWHQQETINFQCELWLKHFTCPTLCPKIMRITQDSGTAGLLKLLARFSQLCDPILQGLVSHLKADAPLRVEMYCRELTERFEDVWIVSGPLTLPQTGDDGKRRVIYQVIGKDDVAVPSHLYKVILARRSKMSSEPLVLGAFVVPNNPIGFDHQLPEFQVNIEDLEKMSGVVFFPQVDKTKDVKNICDVDTCKLMEFDEFTLYMATRKVQSARTLHKLEKVMSELREKGIEPDEYLVELYKKKEKELAQQKQKEAREGRAG
ncbi:nuclease EXOG, mitochondrial isoform X2 [Carettochelys insculpta]|uniref:nuclease EXOG, mitochondrial isoform X2 n=1 Tax=Carettochelys insculpta TaxID=44489 RepID=UPI003EB96DA6